MALYQDGILISGANTLPKMTLAEYNALPADQRPTYWERLDADYDDILAEKSDIGNIESGTTASRAYSTGELLYYNGTLHRAKVPIASGATFTEGTNIEPKKVSDVITPMVQRRNISVTPDINGNVAFLSGSVGIPISVVVHNSDIYPSAPFSGGGGSAWWINVKNASGQPITTEILISFVYIPV